MSALPGGRPVMGLSSREAAALRKALTGIQYPADKWQLIDHCSPGPDGTPRAGPGAIRWLWALPVARYTGLRQVLRAAARAAYGRPQARPGTDHHTTTTRLIRNDIKTDNAHYDIIAALGLDSDSAVRAV